MERTEKQKPSFFHEVGKEFKKIIWPTKKIATKQTIMVIIIAAILGVIVAFIDMAIQAGIGIIQ